jgi:nuclear transport factor 2 (NTF2) superfamily protein
MPAAGSPATRDSLPAITSLNPLARAQIHESLAASTLHRRDRRAEGTLAEDVHHRQPLAQSGRIPAGPRGHRSISEVKWNRELDYRLIKEVWAYRENRIAMRFAYEWHDDGGHWYSSYGNGNGGVRRARADATADRQHQRPPDQG